VWAIYRITATSLASPQGGHLPIPNSTFKKSGAPANKVGLSERRFGLWIQETERKTQVCPSWTLASAPRGTGFDL